MPVQERLAEKILFCTLKTTCMDEMQTHSSSGTILQRKRKGNDKRAIFVAFILFSNDDACSYVDNSPLFLF